MTGMDPKARLELLRFVCSFAWTDLKVQQAERDLVMQLAGRWRLGAAELAQVREWLGAPPPADSVDPTLVPQAHREEFLAAAEAIVRADGRVVGAERDSLALFRELLDA